MVVMNLVAMRLVMVGWCMVMKVGMRVVLMRLGMRVIVLDGVAGDFGSSAVKVGRWWQCRW